MGYHNYGGRGIKVCERWLKFENFLVDMGEKPNGKYSIERIDNNGNYEPDNCKWLLLSKQHINKRNNRLISYNGKTQTLSEWAKEFNINPQTLRNRIVRSKWSTKKALNHSLIKGRAPC